VADIEIGLIYRETPHQGRRWCLIGGRLRLNETFRAAVVREVNEALGTTVRCVVDVPVQPLFVAEYLSRRVKGALFDPRQHAIGLTFDVQLRGIAKPRGEALDFQWFNIGQLPDSDLFGFGQKKVLRECIQRLKTNGFVAPKGRG
jgi:8-oxo-dGTP pyrophosphatase MutT (NUDIX family)